MPTMKILLLLFLAVPAFGQSIDSQLDKFKDTRSYTDRYDKFTKETEVQYQSTVKSGMRSLDLTVLVTIPDVGERTYYLSFGNGHGVLYDHDKLRLLLDGEPLEIADETRFDYVAGFMLTTDEWHKIVAAKSVEMQLRGFEAKFSDKLLTALHNLDTLKLPH
jgi:hypothetical protein